MNILITHYSICDYGGLVNDTEIMTEGFTSLGHSVSNVMLTPKSYGLKRAKPQEPRSKGYELGKGTGLWMHHKNGWLGMDCFGFADSSKLPEWRAFVKDFDLIIHQNPVPTLRKEYKGIDTWLRLYTVKVPQIAICPDANFLSSYPHLYKVAKHLRGIVCTHEAGFRGLSAMPVPRILLPGPHLVNLNETKKKIVSNRSRGILSIQNFKPIKHVDDLIRAIPHMNKRTKKVVCGGGIEYHYMTSKNKRKLKYGTVWEDAVKAGMDYRGYIDVNQCNVLMSSLMLHVDCSWSKRYMKLGPHFNRTFIEAMNNGCVPVCTDLGMGGSDIFKPWEHYIEIPVGVSPLELGKNLEHYMSQDLSKIRKANLKMLHHFDHKYICSQLIDHASGEAEGFLGVETGKATTTLQHEANNFMRFFK